MIFGVLNPKKFDINSLYIWPHTRLEWNLKLMTTNFGLKKLETSFYRTVQQVFQHSELFRCDSRVWDRQMDERTDRTDISNGMV